MSIRTALAKLSAAASIGAVTVGGAVHVAEAPATASPEYHAGKYVKTGAPTKYVKTTKTAAEMEPTGLVLALYRHRFGTVPVEVGGVTAPLDVAAAWTRDRTALTVAVVNPTDEARQIALDVRGAEPTGEGMRFVLTGTDRWAHNAPGRPRGVDVTRTSLETGADRIAVAPLSVTLQVVRAR